MESNAPHPDNWPGFVKLANEALKASQPKTYRRYITLMLEPSFDNHVLLQLQWEEEGIRWYRSVWMKDEDCPKFLNPLEQIKYTGKTISPALHVESGIVKPEDAEVLMSLLRSLKINPFIDDEGRIVLDGCVHTLTFSTDYSTSSSFVWNYLPETYSELRKLTNLMETICKEH